VSGEKTGEGRAREVPVAQDDEHEADRGEQMGALRDQVELQLGSASLSTLDTSDADLMRFSPDLPDELDERERERLLARVAELEPWLQGPFALGGDLVIGGAWRIDHRWQTLRPHVPDIEGRRVLDVGSNAGYDPFMFKLLGAADVMACEPFQFIRQMEFLESIYRTGIRPCQMRWQELDPERDGRFDLVHCHGVLYHEVHPMVLLERLRAMLADGGTLLFGSMMLADPELSEHARFVPGAYYNDPSWWWVPGRLAMRWMLETVGLQVQEEFGLAPGPPGEFATVNGYFRALRGEPAAGLTAI
jgi:tRNA (mo5U34)-methyltransferase